MVEISGRENKIEAFIEQMRPFGILEMVRTGRIAMLRDDGLHRRRAYRRPTPRRSAGIGGKSRVRLTSFGIVTSPLNRSQTPRPRPKMPAKIYYDDDADLSLLKDKTIAILGYGSQGHAQAQNLRDSGCKVIIGQRPGSANYDLAVTHGFKPVSLAEATKAADIVNILLPDEVQGDLFRSEIRPNLQKGNLLLCSHGFNIHFGQVIPPEGVDSALVAPKGPATWSAASSSKAAASPA